MCQTITKAMSQQLQSDLCVVAATEQPQHRPLLLKLDILAVDADEEPQAEWEVKDDFKGDESHLLLELVEVVSLLVSVLLSAGHAFVRLFFFSPRDRSHTPRKRVRRVGSRAASRRGARPRLSALASKVSRENGKFCDRLLRSGIRTTFAPLRWGCEICSAALFVCFHLSNRGRLPSCHVSPVFFVSRFPVPGDSALQRAVPRCFINGSSVSVVGIASVPVRYLSSGLYGGAP